MLCIPTLRTPRGALNGSYDVSLISRLQYFLLTSCIPSESSLFMRLREISFSTSKTLRVGASSLSVGGGCKIGRFSLDNSSSLF